MCVEKEYDESQLLHLFKIVGDRRFPRRCRRDAIKRVAEREREKGAREREIRTLSASALLMVLLLSFHMHAHIHKIRTSNRSQFLSNS